MAKLWQKDYHIDALIEDFTVGRDYLLDTALVTADCLGSLAHAGMLGKTKLITEDETHEITSALTSILKEHIETPLPIQKSQEDCHTAIEERLIGILGNTGKRIHTGRSRNDQVLTAMRLFNRDFLLKLMDSLDVLINTLLDFAEKNKNVPVPGRTHLQVAMPSSVGLWAASYAEESLLNMQMLRNAYELNDSCPLGAAASYGVPLPLDRGLTAELLGFSRVQNNVLAVNNSRGKMEAIILDALEHIMLTFSRMAQDLILFSLPELGYFSIPDALCSGSSIMPQKKNPDALELLRAKASTMASYNTQVKSVLRNLFSGYNRDLQETKEPFLKATMLAFSSISVMKMTVTHLKVNEDKCAAGFTPEIFATDKALELVSEGMTFRDAYKKVGLSLNELKNRNPAESLLTRTSQGSPGNLRLDIPVDESSRNRKYIEMETARLDTVYKKLCGLAPDIFILREL